MRLGDELLAAIDAKAERLGTSRAEIIRALLADAMQSKTSTDEKLNRQLTQRKRKKEKTVTNWIVQHNPAQYDTDNPKFLTEWNMTRYHDQISPGDNVAIWISGRQAGVYAIAKIGDGEPQLRVLTAEDGWKGDNVGKQRQTWPLEGGTLLAAPILKSTLKADTRFENALILRMPHAGNPFPVTDQEWDAISSRIAADE